MKNKKPVLLTVFCFLSSVLCLFTNQGWGYVLNLELDKKSPVNSAWRSVFLPGAGQYFNGERTKSYVFGGTVASGLAATIWLANRANNLYDDYKARGLKNDSLYESYKRKHNQALITGSFTVAVWTSSVIDAYVVSKRLSLASNISLVPVSDGGISICIKKRF